MTPSLTRKILVPTIIGLLVLTGILMTIATISQQQAVIRAEDQSLTATALDFSAELESRADNALSLAQQIALQPTVQKAVAEHDTEALLAELMPAYETLKADFGVRQAHFHLPPATTLLRLHNPEHTGDDLSAFRQTVVDVNKTLQPVKGIEIGVNGGAIRGVTPVFYQGEHVGSFEIGMLFDEATLQHLQEVHGGEWHIFLDKESSAIARSSSTAQGFEIDAPGPTDNMVTLISTTDLDEGSGDFLPVAAGSYRNVLSSNQTVIQRLKMGDDDFAVVMAPLVDYSGETIGVVQIEYLRNDTVAMMRRNLFFFVGVGLGVSALLIAALVLVIRPALKPLAVLNASAHQIAEGNLDTRIVVKTRDEIGQLAQAFQAMVERLKESFATLDQRMRDLVLAQRQADEANRLKSEFLATMSHELRTPLNAMIGFSEIMLAGMGGELDEDASHMTERIHENSERLLNMINDVLDLSKIEAKRVELIEQPFSPVQMTQELCGQMQSMASRQHLAFEYRVDPTLPETLIGDRHTIEQVVTNLLSNAFKFTEAGRVELLLDKVNGSNWTITVRDTGIGIPPHALEFIFDPFRQLDGTSQRAYSGSGLGLAIVRELVSLMKGTIKVESAVGRGSSFIVTLPLVTEKTAAEVRLA